MKLLFTEKNKSAKAFATCLLKNYEQKKVGKYILYHDDELYILGLSGHVLARCYPTSKWTMNWSEILNAPIEKTYVEESIENVINFLKKINIKEIFCATDNDGEGELIAKDFLYLLNKAKIIAENKRIIVNALLPNVITNAFKSPSVLNVNLANAVELRHEIDLQWGVALTRYLTVKLSNKKKWRSGSKTQIVSAGRVQTPVLGLIVAREAMIKNHVKEKFYVATIDLKGFKFTVKDTQKICFSEQKKVVEVKVLKQQIVTVPTPKPLNTSEFLMKSAKIMDPSLATKIAQKLYLEGYITYIRTDSQEYPVDFDHETLLRDLNLCVEKYTYRKGKSDPAHLPITPCNRQPTGLNELQQKVYDLIKNHYHSIFLETTVYLSQTVGFELEGYTFTFKYNVTKIPGWSNYIANPTSYVQFTTEILSEAILVEEKETKPPSAYTNADLLKKMQTLKLGTKSTRQNYVPILKSRKYIGTNLRPTYAAINLINLLTKYAQDLTGAELTKQVELDMELVEKGDFLKQEIFLKYTKKLDDILQQLHAN